MISERMIFACHTGLSGQRRVGILMEGHALPIAFSTDSRVAESGLLAAQEFFGGDNENFFLSVLGSDLVDGPQPNNGLWVYEITHDNPEREDGVDEPDWSHLIGGDFRRPTDEELRFVACLAPLDGWVLV